MVVTIVLIETMKMTSLPHPPLMTGVPLVMLHNGNTQRTQHTQDTDSTHKQTWVGGVRWLLVCWLVGGGVPQKNFCNFYNSLPNALICHVEASGATKQA